MKTIRKIRILFVSVATTIVSLTFSCKKDDNGSPDFPPGDLKVEQIYPDSASAGTVITLRGAGLGSIASIRFENGDVPAYFNPVFNNERALIFRVPDTANGGTQHLILTNSAGKSVNVPFHVLALPSVTSVSNYNFSGNSQITLKGNNLADVTAVKLPGRNEQGTIVSQTKNQLVLTLPSAITRSPLILENSSGSDTTVQEFVNLEKAFKLFTDGYGEGIDNGSWGPASISTAVAKSGTASFAATYNKGNWSADGFANWGSGVPYMPEYKYFSFWVKGASKDYTLYLVGGGRPLGFGNGDTGVPIAVPKDVWTYYRLSVEDIKLWANKQPFNQIGWFIQGPDDQDETFYFDDVIFIK